MRSEALLIAESANPEWTSVPLVGWSHARAIQQVRPSHIVTQIRNARAFDNAGVRPSEYTAIDSESLARPLSRIAELLRGGANRGWTTVTALQSLSYPYFERLIWKQFELAFRSGSYELVHRITPLSPTMPSPLARRLHRLGVPFVLGPLNGGIPWPRQFDAARRKEREWLSYVRDGYKLLPGYAATRHRASAVICGSLATLHQMPASIRGKCVYLPENAIDPTLFPDTGQKPPTDPLRVAFIGRLVPYKGADMLIEAALPLLRRGKLKIDIVGDGPEAPVLREQVRQSEVTAHVSFAGWLPMAELRHRLASCHMLGFPSVREFGGAVVLEAMALGLVPAVVDYGGPAELITPDTGFCVPLGDRTIVVAGFRRLLEEIVSEPAVLAPMRIAGRERVLKHFTWQAKAEHSQQIYRWVLGQAHKPSFSFLKDPTTA